MAVTLNANSSTGFIATSDTSGVLQLQTGGTTAISIDASQNVNFSVTGQRITGDFSNATVANRVAFQTSTVNGNTSIECMPNGTATVAALALHATSDIANSSVLQLRAENNNDIRISAANRGTGTFLPMTFFTGNSESLRLSATTKAVILAGGSTSANGTGITFPATQSASSDANTLDDYEEGVWTPAMTNLTINSGTPTFSGTYTKIGRLVFVYWAIGGTRNITVTANSTYINNMPFASSINSFGGWGKTSTLDVFYGTINSSNLLYFTNTLTTSENVAGSIVYTV